MSVQTQAQPSIKPQSTQRRIPFLAILIGIAVVLAALNLAVTGIRQLVEKPGQTAPGALLYATTFQNVNDTDWYQYQGASSIQIADGMFKVSMDELNNSIFSPLNYPFGDFDVRVVVRQLSGDDPFSEYGILFRYQDKQNYYMFRVEGDGWYRVQRVLNGQAEDLSARHASPSFAPGANHVNDLRVVAHGNQFRFYLNDQLLMLCLKGSDKRSTWNGDQCVSNGGKSDTLTDMSFADGQIGLGVYENESTVQVAFSNLVIYAPSS